MSESMHPSIDALRRTWENDPGARTYLQLAELLREQGQVDEAVDVLERSLEHRPRDPRGRVALAQCRLDLAQPAVAAELLETVIQQDPAHAVANKLLVDAYLRADQAGAAEDRLKIYRLLNDRDPDLSDFADRLQALRRRASASATAPVASTDAAPAMDEIGELSPQQAVDRLAAAMEYDEPLADQMASFTSPPAMAPPAPAVDDPVPHLGDDGGGDGNGDVFSLPPLPETGLDGLWRAEDAIPADRRDDVGRDRAPFAALLGSRSQTVEADVAASAADGASPFGALSPLVSPMEALAPSSGDIEAAVSGSMSEASMLEASMPEASMSADGMTAAPFSTSDELAPAPSIEDEPAAGALANEPAPAPSFTPVPSHVREPEPAGEPAGLPAPAESNEPNGPVVASAPIESAPLIESTPPFDPTPPVEVTAPVDVMEPPAPADSMLSLESAGPAITTFESELPAADVAEVSAPDPRATETLGRMYLDQGHLDEAEEIFRGLLEQQQSHERAREALDELQARRDAAVVPPVDDPPAQTPEPAEPEDLAAPALRAEPLSADDLLHDVAEAMPPELVARKIFLLNRYSQHLRAGNDHVS
ncbi:MAG: tetratricopeptide repeat protein [Acidobacteriota bacterium]